MVTNFIQKFEDDKKQAREELIEATKDATKSVIDELKVELQNVGQSLKEFTDFKIETHERLGTVETDIKDIKSKLKAGLGTDDIEKVKAALLPELEASLGATFKSQLESSHKANLAKEVWEHDHCLIIHGNKADASQGSIKKFLMDEMKVSEEAFNKLKIKEIIKLGCDNQDSKN